MLKKATRIFTLAICLFLTLCLLAGCSGKPTPVDTAIVWGACANSKQLPLNTQGLDNSIYNSCRTYGSVSVVIPQGDAVCVADFAIDPPAKSGLSANKLKQLAEEHAGQIKQVLSNSTATSGERDVLEAIVLAGRTLSGDDDHAKTLVVMDTGLSTCGLLDFAHGNLLDVEPQQILTALESVEGVPDLSGVDVVWFYLGDTAAPQEDLTPALKNKLEDIWTEILTAGQAQSVTFLDDLPRAEGYTGLPPVSTVSVQQTGIAFDKAVVLDGEKVSFVGDRAEYVDPAAAMEALKPIAMTLNAHPDVCVLIAGTTATGGREYCRNLSEMRAETVKDSLVSLGVDPAQLYTMGLGCEDPWHIPDTTDGQLNERAAENRAVRVINVESEEARALMNK